MAPLALGAKVVVTRTVRPGTRVSGRARPVVLSPAPATLAWEMVRFELPVLLRTSARDNLLPIETLPKLTVEGLTVSWPGAVVAKRKMLSRTNPPLTNIREEPRGFNSLLLLRAISCTAEIWSSCHRMLRPGRSGLVAVHVIILSPPPFFV